ncbi:TonB-dependent receptor [Flavobacterium sp. 7A]|uniref:TonB-dependent receptor n=1 Tax=Flavobacterium sp. 7A TaxID=2940571 RepID=UPI002227D292|nr:TonB-dependent receptor [Flavobacterium sp. 7A]MCW2119309.1 iron complex outermembrane receptor protein [Flavobacterium sp. 7A]
MSKKIYVFFCLILFCSSIYSQNNISGKIISEKRINSANTHIHINNKVISSNSSGQFQANDLPSGTTKIFVSHAGYQPIDTVIALESNLKIDFKLKPNTTLLDEVVIQQKNKNTTTSVVAQQLKLATIEKYSNQTLGDALKEIAGVATLKSGNSIVKPIINGLYGSRVPVIYNNVRLEDQQWGMEHDPNIDINTANKITVIKGSSGLQYGGDAIGGLIIIEPLTVKKDTLFGRTIINYDSNGKGGSVTTSLHQGNDLGLSWNATGTYKYLGDKQAPDYNLSNTGTRNAHFSGDLKYSAAKFYSSLLYSYYNATIGILSASHTGNVNDLYNSITNKIPSVINDFTYNINNPKQKVKHQIIKFNSNYYFDNASFLSLQYDFQSNNRLEYDVRRADFNDIAALDLELKTHTLAIDYTKNTHDWELKTGVRTAVQNNYANPATGIRPLIPNYDKLDLGIYGIASYRFSDRFSIDGGVRNDYTKIDASKFYLKSRWEERGYDAQFYNFIAGDFGTQWLTKPSFTFNSVSANVGTHIATAAKWELFSNLSFASRNPNPSEFFSDGLHHSTGVIELGDLNLKKEQATKLSVTVKKQFNRFSFELNPYLNSIKDYIFLKPTGFETTIRGAFPVYEYQQTNAVLAGVDLQTVWEINNQWAHSLRLSYVSGRDKQANEPLIDMPPLQVNNKITFSKKEWNSLRLELQSELVFRQTQFPDNNFYTQIIKDNELVSVLVDTSTPPTGYQLFHFYSEMKFKTFKKATTTVAFSIQNMFNASYRDYLNRQRFFADEVGRSIQLQLKFNY